MGPTQGATHVFQSDDVGVLPVSHQDLDLFGGISLDLVYYLRHEKKQEESRSNEQLRIACCASSLQKLKLEKHLKQQQQQRQ